MTVANDTLGLTVVLLFLLGICFLAAGVIVPVIMALINLGAKKKLKIESDDLPIIVCTLICGAVMVIISLALYPKASSYERIYKSAQENYIKCRHSIDRLEKEYPEFKDLEIEETTENE